MKLTLDCSGIRGDAELILEACAGFCAKRLQIPAKTRVVVYRTKFRGKDYRHTHGECQMVTPRLFLVKLTNATIKGIENLNREDVMFFTHELVHVSQFSRGTLRYTKAARFYWKNKQVTQDVAYEDDPAEKDAFKRGWKLADEFLMFWHALEERE